MERNATLTTLTLSPSLARPLSPPRCAAVSPPALARAKRDFTFFPTSPALPLRFVEVLGSSFLNDDDHESRYGVSVPVVAGFFFYFFNFLLRICNFVQKEGEA